VTPIALTGIKPSGTPHIGNYFGMIEPALELVRSYRAFYFVADYHSLTTTHDRHALQRQSREAAAAWLALGLDPERAVFYRQADIPELFEMMWVLTCCTAKGLLNRAHAYKSAVDANRSAGRPADENIHAGLYNYPVLMAADILLFGADVVPVGPDQKQHVEIVRDIAAAFNVRYGDFLKLPQALIRADRPTVPGLDGRKMSKSYGNTIPIFAEPEVIRKQVRRIVTDSKRPEAPKDPDTCNVFGIYRHVAPPEGVAARRARYLKGGLAYSDIKTELAERLVAKFADRRRTYTALLDDTAAVDGILRRGARRARAAAGPMLARIRRKIGIDPARMEMDVRP
jgi:tryptophanyl-tRNA synthetase